MRESEPDSLMRDPLERSVPMPGLSEVFADWSPDQMAGCHASLRALYGYWNAKRGSRLMPTRGDIDPVDLKSLLPLMILIDVVPDLRRYVYRLVGTHEVEMRGGDPTGKAVDEAYYGESAESTMSYLDRVVHTQQPVLYRGIYQPLSTRTQREDVLFLPLSRDGQSVTMIMILGHVDWLKDEATA